MPERPSIIKEEAMLNYLLQQFGNPLFSSFSFVEKIAFRDQNGSRKGKRKKYCKPMIPKAKFSISVKEYGKKLILYLQTEKRQHICNIGFGSEVILLFILISH